MKKPICKLISPSGDKSWSFQAINVNQQNVNKILLTLSDETVKKANPFLQGNSDQWVMVEFWTDSNETIHAAAEKLFELFHQDVIIAEDFTSKELGLN